MGGGFLNLGQLLGNELAWLDEYFWQKACELRVSVPVVVTNFDSSTQTVTVQPAIKENLLPAGIPTPTNLPPLSNVIVGLFRSGGFAITTIPAAGDEGWVVFADMCIDAWWQSGGTANNQVERRRHDLTDGFFIPAGWSQPRKLASLSPGLQIRSDDGTIYIELDASGTVKFTPDNGTTIVSATAGAIALTATQVTVNGNLQVNGNINGTGTLDGKTFLTHVHTGVTTGSGDTGPPL